LADSGRPYNAPPDFLTGALNTLKGFGQGVSDFLQPAQAPIYDVPVAGGALRSIVESPLGRAAGFGGQVFNRTQEVAQGLVTSALGGAIQATSGQPNEFGAEVRRQAGPNPNLFSMLGAGGDVVAQRRGELPGIDFPVIGRQDLLSLQGLLVPLPGVRAARPSIPAVENLASRIGADIKPSGAIGADLSAIEAKIAAAGKVPLTKVSQAEALASEAANPSLVRAPQGIIASRMAELKAQGLTDQQAFNAAQHQFGQQAAIRWINGDDIVVRPTEFRPNDIGPKMGSGAPRENLGVNLDKIDAPAATKDYIAQVAADNAGFEAQRRGVVTIAETQATADKIAIDAQKYAYIKPGTAFNAEQLKSTFDAMVTKGNEVTALQEALRAEKAAGISSKATELRALAASVEHQTLQRVFAGGRAESGRALRVQREIADGLRSGDVNGTWNRAVALLGGKDNADALLGRMQDIWTDPKLAPAEREVALYKFVQHMDEASTAEKIHEYWTNAILSSPSTHIVNITGQTLLQIADMGTNFLTAAVEALTSGFGKIRPREYTFSAAFGSFGSLGRGFRQAVMNLRDADKIAATKFKETGQVGAHAIGGPVGNVVNIPTKLLGAEDAVFRGIGEARGLYEGAYNTAAKEGLRPFSSQFAQRVSELIDNPTEEIVAHMETMGKRAGLRQDPGHVSQALIALRQDVHIGPVQPLRFVIPFITTPVNLMKVGVEYSPLGFVRAIGAKGAGRSEAIARAALGSAAMGYFAQEFAAGNVTAGPPQNPAEKDAFYAQGKIPYAVRVGGTWYSFSRLEPIATPLKWTAALMQTAEESKGKSWDVTASKMVFALARYMEDSTYLQGLSDLVDALQDPNKAASFVENIVTGFNPAIVRRVTQANDPFIRDPRNIVEQIEATLPYLNEQVPVRQTAFGEPAKRTEGKQGISGVISPVDYNPELNDPLLQKVASYHLPEGIGPDGQMLPVRGLTVGLVNADIATFGLNDSEAQRYQQYAGQATRNLLDKLFSDKLPYNDQNFSTLPYEDQVRAIRKTISDARDVGRAQVADEIVHAASNDGQVARGAIMRLSVIGKLRDEARYLEGLQRQGVMTPTVRRLIDERKAQDKPVVAEYVRYAPLIEEYVRLPKYRVGDEAEWNALAQAKRDADKYAADTDKPPQVETWRWYMQVNPEGANLIRKYARTALRDPRRQQMLRDNPGLERYVSGA
jgi:hypothetical protein